MNFSLVENRLLELRRRLTIALDKDCIGEITVTRPDDQYGELSFLRLVIWCYSLLHENGRVILRFVNKIPAVASSTAMPPHVAALRTWLAHNLSFDKTRDMKKLGIAEGWLINTCGTGSPQTPDHWRICSECLIKEIADLLDVALKACDFFSTDQDGPRLVGQLKHSIERDWPAYRFDEFAELACKRLGFAEVDVPKFRTRHLDAWRKVVDAAQDESIETLLQRRIETDLMVLMNNALPVNAIELDNALGSIEPKALAAAMIVLRMQLRMAAEEPSSYVEALLVAIKEQVSNSTVHRNP